MYVTARAEDDRDRDKGRGTPAAAEDSEASLPDADGQPEDIAVSPQREQTKAASDFDTEYRAGNVRDIELFSIGSKRGQHCF